MGAVYDIELEYYVECPSHLLHFSPNLNCKLYFIIAACVLHLAMSKLETSDVTEASDTSIEFQDSPPDPHTGGHTRRYRKVYSFFGFTRSYNFPLCKSSTIYLAATSRVDFSQLQKFMY